MEIFTKKLNGVLKLKNLENCYLFPYSSQMEKFVIKVEVELNNGKLEGNLQKLDIENGLYWVNDCKFWVDVNKFSTISLIEKNTIIGKEEIKMLENGYNPELVKVLKNGVSKFELAVENDFDAVDEIMEINSHTENIGGYNAYNERVENDFVGTYKTLIERTDDFERFTDMLEDAQKDHRMDKVRAFKAKYYERGLVTFDEYDDYKWKNLYNCSCKLCSFRIPNIGEWKKGMYKMDEKRESKIGKTLTKIGFPQNVIDFYSTQIKTEKEIFVTISGLAQHVAGMANYAEEDSWDSYMGTSCQDTRHEGEESIALGGSLHDNKLFVAMLHDELEDVQDMQDKLIARSVMRLVHVDYLPMLVAVGYYGDNETKDILHTSIGMLSEVDIYNTDVVRGSNRERHVEPANGAYTLTKTESVHVYETIEEEVDCTCPMCSGSGEYSVMTNNFNEVDVTCPLCNGSGDYQAYVCTEVDEWIEVEDEEQVKPYDEGYTHKTDHIVIHMNIDSVRDMRVVNGLTLV